MEIARLTGSAECPKGGGASRCETVSGRLVCRSHQIPDSRVDRTCRAHPDMSRHGICTSMQGLDDSMCSFRMEVSQDAKLCCRETARQLATTWYHQLDKE